MPAREKIAKALYESAACAPLTRGVGEPNHGTRAFPNIELLWEFTEMRLTLRTMLAYLDDVLDVDDAAELGAKIEESEFATGLVQRIRNSMNRPRLDSPPLEGRGMGHDPNTVAEYLDNTLPAERMPDFERVCLESDSHLAEAASCHQILTLVLGESANVPAEMRQRMYRMGAQVEGTTAPPVQPPPVGEEGPESSAAGAPSEAGDALDGPMPARQGRRNKPEVPDYIKTRSSLPLLPIALVLLLLLGLGGTAYMFKDTLSNFVAMGGEEAEGENGLEQKDLNGEDTPQKGEEGDTEEAADAANENTGEEESEAAGQPADVVEGAAATEGETAAEGATDEGTHDEVPAETIVEDNGGETPADAGGEDPPVEHVADAQPNDGTIPGVTDAGATGQGAELGRYTSDRQVLLRYNNDEALWYRLPSQTILASGDTWMAPLAYRPQLTLASGLQLTLDGPTRLTMLPPAADETPFLDMEYGKAVIVTIGRPNARLGLRMGDRQGELVFVDAASTCAIEVQRAMPFGANPEETESMLGSRIYCTRGTVSWVEDGQAPQEVPAGSVIETYGAAPARMGEYLNAPAWFSGDHLNPSDKLGSPELEPMLEEERPADLALQERANDRRAEVRSLAARSLCYLGVYEPAIEALGDETQRSTWSDHLAALRHALATSPEAAAEVRTTLERKRREDAGNLYRMMWGYTQQDLENGADAELVAALESESLDVRVLALENLREITGKYLLYRPEAAEGNRRTSVARWREQLEAGAIRYVGPAAAEAPAEAAPAEGGGEDTGDDMFDPPPAAVPAEGGAEASVEG